MHITIFIGGLSGGGAERVACNLANDLASKNHRVTMLTMSETENTYGLQDSVVVHPLISRTECSKKIFGNVLRYIRLRRYIKETKCDIFLVMLPITTILLLGLRRMIKVPVIAAERCDPASYSKIKNCLLQKLAVRADAWVFQTADAMKWYEGRIKQGIVIPNAINPAFLRPPYMGEREKTIVGAGRLADQKNFPLLLEAFAAVADRFPAYRLVIYGKGPQEALLKAKAAELGLQDRVTFAGYVENMPEELEKAGIFVLSSNYEGMPNALMEAMALGLPVISTDCPCGGPKFLIEHGKNGLLVPVGDVTAITEALTELLEHPEKANAMGQAARTIAEPLAPEVIYAKWEAYIKDLVDKRA